MAVDLEHKKVLVSFLNYATLKWIADECMLLALTIDALCHILNLR